MKTVSKILASSVVFAALSAQGATTAVQNVMYGFAGLDFNPAGSVTIPAFTGAGTWNSTTLTGTGSLQFGVVNNSPAAETFAGTLGVTFNLVPTGATFAPGSIAVGPVPFGPVLLGAGGGATFGPFNSAVTPIVVTGANGAAIPVAINTSTALTVTQGGGAIQIASQGKVSFDVVYDFTPRIDNNIPEPKVYGAIGALLSLGVLGYRQYRLKKA